MSGSRIAAALALRGNGALLNFPKLAHSLPRLADLSDKSIQAAATLAANNFAQRDMEAASDGGRKESRNNAPKSSSSKSSKRSGGSSSSSSNRYHVIDSSGPVENLQHPMDAAQPMYVDSEDMFTIGPGGLTHLYDAMCIPPPDAEHTETDGEEGANTWEPHLWSY